MNILAWRVNPLFITFMFIALFGHGTKLVGLDQAPLSCGHLKDIHSNNEPLFFTRPAKMGDEDVLYELIRELAQYEGKDIATLPLTKENLRRFGFSENPHFCTEFAECEDKVVGYALYYYAFSANQGRPILYLEDLYVKPEYRGIGIGSQFLKQLAKYATQNDCCRLEWHVFSWNDSAISFYQKLGGVLRNDLIQVRLEKDALQRLAND
ncbi:MAG: GNAT family N-acetyltransferase [Chlamydiales bacterium]